MVASFLRSNLADVLTADSCFHWLKVTSAVGLADLATTCVGFIVQNTLPITRDMLEVLHKQQATDLCVALRDALSASLAGPARKCLGFAHLPQPLDRSTA
jgi:hypothetical protein